MIAWTQIGETHVAEVAGRRGWVSPSDGRWSWCAQGEQTELGAAASEADARRLVEEHLGVLQQPDAAMPAWADPERAARVEWTAAQYHASDRLSRSDLVLFEESARLYHGVRRTKTIAARSTTAGMRFGTLVHLRVLEPDEFRRVVWVKPADFNGRTNAGKSELAEIRAQGRIECEMEEAQRIEGCAAALLADGAARKMIEQCEREVTFTWTEQVGEGTPVPCRARLDLLAVREGKALIADLKTTDDPSPREFGRSCATFGYHYQPPFYARPIRELFGVEPLFRFLVVRSRPPHEVVVYRVRPDDIAAADKLVARALQRFAECVLRDTWSSPWERQGVQDLEIPRWCLETRT